MSLVFNSQDFSIERLRSVFRLSLKNAFKPIFFGQEQDIEDKFILWRHDVDLDLSAALNMARTEGEEGIKSTYFFMIRTWFYNIFSKDGEKAIREILGLGHQIGLHCDLGVLRNTKLLEDSIERKVKQEFSLIETAFGKGIFQRLVSFHNPPKSVLRKSFPSFYSAYAEKFFTDIKYLSDSNMIWRNGPIENWLTQSSVTKLSILLHPMIWVCGGETMPEAVALFCQRRAEELIKKLEEDGIRVK